MARKKIDVAKTLIDKMFEIAGHQVTFEDIKDRKDNWYQQYTMTEEQNREWRDWGLDLLKKQGGILKARASTEMAFFDMMYGLKIENNK